MSAKEINYPLLACLSIATLIGIPAYAQSLSPSVDYTISRTAVYDSGSNVRLPLKHAALGECSKLEAVLIQRATALAAELDQITMSECKPDSSGEVSFDFTVPNVTRVTELVWEVKICTGDGRCEAVGDIAFIALPADYLQPLIDWSHEHTLFVADTAGWLVALLDRLGIEYTENARAVPTDDDVVSLLTVATPQHGNVHKDLPRGPVKRIIAFHDYPSPQPMIWVDATASGIVISVRFPLIHEIERDAANKKILYELFQRLFK